MDYGMKGLFVFLMFVGGAAGDTLPTLSLAIVDSSYVSYYPSSSESSSSSSYPSSSISKSSSNTSSSSASSSSSFKIGSSSSYSTSSSSNSSSRPLVSPVQLAVKIHSKQQPQQQLQQPQQQQPQQDPLGTSETEYYYEEDEDGDYDLDDEDYDDEDAEGDDVPLEEIQPRGPFFATNNASTRVYLGSTATLECTVLDLTNESVSWLRLVDDMLELLTWGSHTYTTDDRYSLVQEIGDKWQRWQLVIRDARVDDQGQYRCQVATQPPMLMAMTLNITEPMARVVDERGTDVVDKHYNSGSMIELKCIIEKVPFPHGPVTWRRGSTPLTFNTSRGGISVKGSKSSGYIRSRLYVANASPSDSGVYSCWYSNYTSDNVTVHVIAGENSQAMQHDSLPESPTTTSGSSFTCRPVCSNCIYLLLLPCFTSGSSLLNYMNSNNNNNNNILKNIRLYFILAMQTHLVSSSGLLTQTGILNRTGRTFKICIASILDSFYDSMFDVFTRLLKCCFIALPDVSWMNPLQRLVRFSKASIIR